MASKSIKVVDIEGIGPVYAAKLEAIDVKTVGKLLQAGATPQGRKDLEQKTGIGHALILRWVNHADLYRIKGVGKQYAELLEAAGVDTVVELAKRVPANLHASLAETNQKKKLVRLVPALKLVGKWVDHAKTLPRVVTY